MDKTKETLWKDYNNADDQIKDLKVTDENYKLLLEEKDKIRNEIIKLEQLESETKRDNVRNCITVGTFVVTTGVGVWTVMKTFKFDEVATITSTLGRNSLSNVMSKMFKR